MSEDFITKDAFRDGDGFLVLVNILSSIRPAGGAVPVEAKAPNDQTIWLVFSILAKAMHGHQENRHSFEVCITRRT